MCIYTHTNAHPDIFSIETDYFSASAAQTAQNIRQKLANWDTEHKLRAPQKQKIIGLKEFF